MRDKALKKDLHDYKMTKELIMKTNCFRKLHSTLTTFFNLYAHISKDHTLIKVFGLLSAYSVKMIHIFINQKREKFFHDQILIK